MKKIILFSFALLGSIAIANAQNKYFTREGKVTFLSDAPLEKIEAQNTKAASVLDASTGQLEFSLLMKAFEFDKALLQEHFNENYVESDKFPKSVFRGRIENIIEVKFDNDGIYPVKVTGQLTLHGVTKEVASNGTIEIKNGKVEAKSMFTILLGDYNIEIPKLVNDKISKEIKITINASYDLLGKS